MENYRIKILEPRKVIESGDLENFKTDLKEILELISVSGDKKQMKAHIKELKGGNLAYDARVLLESLGFPKRILEKETEEKSMEWKGLIEAFEDNKEEGRQEGISQGLMQSVDNVMKNIHMSLNEACDAIGITVADYNKAKEENFATKA